MKDKASRRRYRLRAAVKKVTRIDARSKTVFVNEDLLAALNHKENKWLTELRDRFRYNIQFEIS